MSAETHTVEDAAKEFLSAVEYELRGLSIAVNLAHWEASTTGTVESIETATECEARLRKFLSSETRYRRITELLDSTELHDPLARRQLELLARWSSARMW